MTSFGGANDVLISAAALAQALESERRRPVLLDVRWQLGDPHGRKHYVDGHLPGAVFVDLDEELAAVASAVDGRHPLPEAHQLQTAARRWGINNGDAVVVYDANGNTAAARAWWLLRWAGLSDVRLLDGGLGAWERAGGELEHGEVTPPVGNMGLRTGQLPIADADAAARIARDGVLLDARAGERYRGEAEPIDPRAGHIPGATSAPTGDNLNADGTFRSAAELRARFAGLGVTNSAGIVAAYCGSGVTASHQIAALAIAGVDAVLYPGSWSQWSNDPTRPVAVGSEPDGGSR